MYEILHRDQGSGECFKYKYMDIYVKDRAEALTVNRAKLTQGSKLYIIETAELYVLNENGGLWCSAVDGTVLA